MLSLLFSIYLFFITVSNLFISVVIITLLLSCNNALRPLPVPALDGFIAVFAKLSFICLSRSILSVTIINLGLSVAFSFIIFFTSITIVKDLPLPCVCHITPPSESELSTPLILSIACLTAKNC